MIRKIITILCISFLAFSHSVLNASAFETNPTRIYAKEELENGLNLNNDKEIAIHELGKYTQGVIQETNDIWFLIGKYTLEEYLDADL